VGQYQGHVRCRRGRVAAQLGGDVLARLLHRPDDDHAAAAEQRRCGERRQVARLEVGGAHVVHVGRARRVAHDPAHGALDQQFLVSDDERHRGDGCLAGGVRRGHACSMP
jgi:GGDEF domain-containing protein